MLLCVCVCVYLAVMGLLCCLGISRWQRAGLLSGCGVWASNCSGFSCGGAQAFGRAGFSSRGTWAQDLPLEGPGSQAQSWTCSVACGIFLDQG